MEQTQWEMRKDNVGNGFTLSELGAPGGSEQEGDHEWSVFSEGTKLWPP